MTDITSMERELALLRMGLRSLRKEFSEKLQAYRLTPPVTDNDMEVIEHYRRDIAEIDALIAKYAAPAAQQVAANHVMVRRDQFEQFTNWMALGLPAAQQVARNDILEEAAKAIEAETIQWGQSEFGRVNATFFADVVRALKTAGQDERAVEADKTKEGV